MAGVAVMAAGIPLYFYFGGTQQDGVASNARVSRSSARRQTRRYAIAKAHGGRNAATARTWFHAVQPSR